MKKSMILCLATVALLCCLKLPAAAQNAAFVKDIYPGSSGYSSTLTVMNNVLYFVAQDGVYGRELWRSDGTNAGTWLVKDINPGSLSSGPQFITNCNGILHMMANDGKKGEEIWKSNGTVAGTVLVKDIYKGSEGSWPKRFYFFNGYTYFAAASTSFMANGAKWGADQFYGTDGTAAGRVPVTDINPGAGSSDLRFRALMNGTMYFFANDGVHGLELWRYAPPAPKAGLISDGAIHNFSLSQNYPNPFNPAASITFSLPENMRARISVHDQLGREVAMLADAEMSGGVHILRFDAGHLPGGIYVCRLETPLGTLLRRIHLVKCLCKGKGCPGRKG